MRKVKKFPWIQSGFSDRCLLRARVFDLVPDRRMRRTDLELRCVIAGRRSGNTLAALAAIIERVKHRQLGAAG